MTKSIKQPQYNLSERIFFIVFLLLYFSVFAVRLPKILFDGQAIFLIQAFTYVILGISGIVLFRNHFIEGIINWKYSALKNVLWLFGAYIVYIIISNIALYPAYAFGIEVTGGNATGILVMIQTIGRPMAIIVIGLVGPIVEECVFRAFLIGKTKTKVPLWICIISSSLLFTLMHLQGLQLLNFFDMLPHFVGGLVYGILYAATDNITLPVILHIINNMMGIVFYAYNLQ